MDTPLPNAAPARAGLPTDAAGLRDAIVQKLTYDLGKSRLGARDRDWFIAAALVVRDHIVDRWIDLTRAGYTAGTKQVYYPAWNSW
jgi:starch phosphorylase